MSFLLGTSPENFLSLWVSYSTLAWAPVSSSDLCLPLVLKPYLESAQLWKMTWGEGRFLGTNGGALWLWCCLAQPGAVGP